MHDCTEYSERELSLMVIGSDEHLYQQLWSLARSTPTEHQFIINAMALVNPLYKYTPEQREDFEEDLIDMFEEANEC